MDYEPPPPFAPPTARVQPLAVPPAMYGAVPPPAPAPRRPSWQSIALAAAAITAMAVVAIVGLVRAGHLSDGTGIRQHRTLSLPDRAGDYVLVRTIDASMIRSMLGGQIGSLGLVQDALDTARIGVYGQSATAPPTVIFVGFAAADSPTIADLLDHTSASNAVDQVLAGTAGSGSPTSLDPGPLGGVLKCENAERNATLFTPCAWADRDTLGVVMRVGTVPVEDAAQLTRTLRAAAER